MTIYNLWGTYVAISDTDSGRYYASGKTVDDVVVKITEQVIAHDNHDNSK